MHISNRCKDAKARMSRLSTHITSLTVVGNAVAVGLLTAALALSTTACRDAPSEQHSLAAVTHATEDVPPQSPVPRYSDSSSACLADGGKYLGDMRCQMADGSVELILVGAAAIRASTSATAVMPQTPHAWALATTAIMFEFNADRHDLLAGAVANPDGEAKGKQLLSDWWSVDTKDELLDTLNWLQFEGHRADFDELGRQVSAMNEMQFESTKAAVLIDEQQTHRLDVVRKNYRLLGNKGILAWDLVRYIALCRWGYLAGYLSDVEAWDLIMPAARRLQQTFSSWRDLQENYLIGRDFWSVQQTQKTGDGFRAIYEHFIQDSNSPWNVNSWTMDLGTVTPMSVVAH